jgi:hypothetical protein
MDETQIITRLRNAIATFGGVLERVRNDFLQRCDVYFSLMHSIFYNYYQLVEVNLADFVSNRTENIASQLKLIVEIVNEKS